MNTPALLALTLLLAGPTAAQTFNKCTAADGTVTYAQTQCPDAAGITIDVRAQKADPRLSNQIQEAEDLAQQCLPFMTFRLKDPASARIERVGVMNLDTMKYEGAMILAYKLGIWINAKNSYGGYAGDSFYYCYISQHDKRVLRVDPA